MNSTKTNTIEVDATLAAIAEHELLLSGYLPIVSVMLAFYTNMYQAKYGYRFPLILLIIMMMKQATMIVMCKLKS